jgi:hypothetical protein
MVFLRILERHLLRCCRHSILCSTLLIVVDGGDVPDCGVRVSETIMGRQANVSWTPMLVADFNPRTLSLSNSGVSETPSTRGLLMPTFVMLSDVVDRYCRRNGFCFALYKVKAYPCVQRDVLDDIHRIPQRIGSNKNRQRSLRNRDICKHSSSQPSPYKHHVVRPSRNSNHRRSIRCLASGVWCLPAIRDHRSVSSDGFSYVPCVCNGRGIERVSMAKPPHCNDALDVGQVAFKDRS